MNFEILLQDFLKALRGAVSQTEISYRLGYRYNQYYRWERSLVRLSWPEFTRVCRCLNVDIEGGLCRFFGWDAADCDLQNIFYLFAHSLPISQIAHDLQRSRRTIQRWLHRDSQPDLIDILKIINMVSNGLPELLDYLVKGNRIPSLSKELAARRTERKFHIKHPEFAGLIRCLELNEYEQSKHHSHGFVSKKSGLTEAEVRSLLVKATKLGILVKSRGKYKITNQSLSTGGDSESRKRILAYWLNRETEAIKKSKQLGTQNLTSSYLIFSTNSTVHNKIRRLTTEYYQNLLNTLMSTDNQSIACPLDRVLLIHLTLMNLEQS